jgi:hypothetical protein
VHGGVNAKCASMKDINLLTRPAAGSLGVVVHPLVGSLRAMKRKMARSPDRVLFNPRQQQGQIDLQYVSLPSRQKMLERFEQLRPLSGRRKAKLRAGARRWFLMGGMTGGKGEDISNLSLAGLMSENYLATPPVLGQSSKSQNSTQSYRLVSPPMPPRLTPAGSSSSTSEPRP